MKSVKSAAVVPTVQTVAVAAIAIIDRETAKNGKVDGDLRRMLTNRQIIAEALSSIEYALDHGLYQGFRKCVRLPIVGKVGTVDLHAGEYSLTIRILKGAMANAILTTNEGWSYNVGDQDVDGFRYALEKLAKAG